MKLTLASLLLTLSAFGQEHAPTVEQCRADAKLWFSEDKAVQQKAEYNQHLYEAAKGIQYREASQVNAEPRRGIGWGFSCF